jgi:MFS family permease
VGTSVRLNRWLVLAGYCLLAACTQLLWLSLAPITTLAHRAMDVSEGAVGDLAGIFPLLYVVLALPAGRWLDARFPRALGTGAALTGGGALLRLAGPGSYGWFLAGQTVIAAGQPLVLNSVTKVAGRYFPRNERTAAISAGSVALFAGVLAAVLTGGPLYAAGGLRLLLGVQGAVAAVSAASVLVAVRAPAAFAGDPPVSVSLAWLRGDRLLWLLAVLLFAGMGIFNGAATWLDTILARFGLGSASGYLIAVMTLAGMLGGALLPEAVARRGRRRALLVTALAVTAAAFALVAAVHNAAVMGCALAAGGLLLLAGLPVVLDWSEIHAGAERAGAAAGFLLLAGNLGGVAVVLLVQAVIGNAYLALAALSAVAVAALPAAVRLPATTVLASTREAAGERA